MKNNLSGYMKKVPKIGVLALDSKLELSSINNFPYPACIKGTYPNFLKDSIVIPINMFRSFEEIKDILPKLNGFFFTGGATNIYYDNPNTRQKQLSEFTMLGFKIIEEIIKINEKGIYYPIAGICLGFQLICCYFAKNVNILSFSKYCFNYCIRNQLEVESNNCKTNGIWNKSELDYFENNDVWHHTHYYTITTEDFDSCQELVSNCYKFSTSISQSNIFEFVSGIEAKKYPFYAFLFHIERNQYGYKGFERIQNDKSNQISKKWIDFFIDECRKNNNTFNSEDLKNFPSISTYDIMKVGNVSLFCLK